MKQGGFSSAILPFIPSDRRKLHLLIIFFAITIQICCLALLFFDVPISMILLIIIGLPLILLLLSSVENFFLLIVIYISTLPHQGYCDIYRGLPPIGVMKNYLYMLFVIFLIYWVFSLILKKRKVKIGVLGYAIIIYICVAFFSFLVGLINANENVTAVGKNELVPQLMYLSYFVFMTTRLKEKNFRQFFVFVLVASVIIGLQNLYAFSENAISGFVRIATNNIHLSLLAFPYVLGILYFTKPIKRKILCVIGLLPISLAVLISLDRSIWLALGLIFILSLFIFFYKKRVSFAKILFIFFIALVAFSLLLFITIFVLSKLTSGGAILVLLKRIISFVNISYLKVDLSVFQRIYEIKQAFSKLNGIEWLIGKGIGDTVYSQVRFVTKHYLDNSYAWIIWKMGIIGLISFLTMFGVFFQRAIFLLRKCSDNEDMIYIMTIFLNIFGLMIIAFINSCLVHYRFITIWAVSMAMMEIIYRKYRNENTINLLK
ncbi:oligosaccharide repeat unit polymerase [candidate division WOR-3 bacterium]|nr:oligosaccharide repeat unit polymerase [candidate division WOR-3 bacterium]